MKRNSSSSDDDFDNGNVVAISDDEEQYYQPPSKTNSSSPSQNSQRRTTQQDEQEHERDDDDVMTDDVVPDAGNGEGDGEEDDETAANRSGFCGTISRVELENFMCHESFSIDLQPCVNFIVGRNGSGKSAILIAICVCLGGKMSFTQRGDSARELIRRGQSKAVIRVFFRNSGPDAYMPKLFPKTLIVERVISASSSGGAYRLKSIRHDERTERTGLKYVKEAMDCYGFLVDNPCVLLMQETAKSFLCQGTPHSMYSFLNKATMLEKIQEDYERTKADLNSSRELLSRKREQLQPLEEHREKLRREMELIKHLADKKREVQNLKDKKAWWFVGKQRRLVQEASERIQRAKQIAEEAEQALKEASAKRDEAAAGLPEVTKAVDSLKEEYTKRKDDCDHIQKELKRKMSRIHELESKINSTNTICERLKRQKEKMTVILEEKRRENAARSEQERGTFTRLKNEKQKIVDDLRQSVKALEDDCQTGELRIRRLRDEVTRIESLVHMKNQDVFKKKQSIRSLEQQQTNRVIAFHSEMPKFVQAVESYRQQHRFRDVVIGPIGTLLTLRDPVWKNAVETVLNKHVLGSFIVFNENDRVLLNQLSKKVRMPLNIMLRKHTSRVYDMPIARDSSILTILRAIKCDNAEVINALVDHHQIERIALVQNWKDASGLVRQRSDLKQAITCNDCVVVQKRGNTFSSTAMHTVSVWFGVDFESRSASLREELAQSQADLAKKQDELKEAKSVLTRSTKEQEELSRKVKNERSLLFRAESELRSAEEQIENSKPVDLAETEQSIANVRERIEKEKNGIRGIEVELEKEKTEHESLNSSVDEAERQKNSLFEEFKRKRQIMERFYTEQRQYDDTVTNAQAKRDEALRKEKELQDDLQASMSKLSQCEEAASKICPEEPQPPWEGSLEELTTVINSRTDELNKQAHSMRREADVERDLEDMNKKCDFAQQAITMNLRLTEEMYHNFLLKQERMIEIRRRRFRCMNRLFSGIMQKRSFEGKLLIDANQETLDIIVKAKEGGQKAVARDTKTLSGGERSYSTISLLLAIWDTMESPVCGLDEFDVFMDAINRRISVKSIIEFAQIKKNRQYIIITPQTDLSINASEYVSIHQLRPPRRAAAVPPPAATAAAAGAEDDD